MGNDGKLFEELVYNKYMSEATYINEEYQMIRRYRVIKNYQAPDFKSGGTRQVDVAIFLETYEGLKFIAIECKDHNAKIDVQELESFIAKLQSINANKGIMVSTSGFTKKALKLACSTLGIKLKSMTPKELEEYLYHDYKYYNGECCLCKDKKSIWTGEKIQSMVLYRDFDNVITKEGKYLKIYSGSCNECFTINYLNEKCGTVTPLFYLGNNSYEWKENEIHCRDNCGLIYVINPNGSVSYKYKGHICNIINSAHVEF